MIANWDLSGVKLHMFDADVDATIEDIMREVRNWIHTTLHKGAVDSVRFYMQQNEWEQFRWLAEVEWS